MGQHYLLQASVFRAAVLFAVVVSVSVQMFVLMFVSLFKFDTLV